MFLNLNLRNAHQRLIVKELLIISVLFFNTQPGFSFYDYNGPYLFYLFSFENPLNAILIIKLPVYAKWQFV
jgi:hypothetical protein